MNWLRREIPEKKKEGFSASTGPITGSFSPAFGCCVPGKGWQAFASEFLEAIHASQDVCCCPEESAEMGCGCKAQF